MSYIHFSWLTVTVSDIIVDTEMTVKKSTHLY